MGQRGNGPCGSGSEETWVVVIVVRFSQWATIDWMTRVSMLVNKWCCCLYADRLRYKTDWPFVDLLSSSLHLLSDLS